MPSLARIVALLSLAALVVAEPRLSPHIVHERRSFNPEKRGWRLARRLEPATVLPVKIGLTQNNLDTIEDVLLAVSHPESPEYGKHWTAGRIVEHFAPSRDTVEAVVEWLGQSGISRDRLRLSSSKGWIQVNATVSEVEDLLKTEYHVWEDDEGGERIGCHEYSIPEHVAPHVDLIKPTVHMGARVTPKKYQKRITKPLEERITQPDLINNPVKLGSPSSFNGPKTNGRKVDGSTTLGLADCDEFITPICLQTLYNVHYKPVATHKNTFGVVEFTPQAFLQTDLGEITRVQIGGYPPELLLSDMFFHNFSATQVGQEPQRRRWR